MASSLFKVRRTRTALVGLFLLSLLLVPGCSSEPEIQPLVFNAAPWQPNEVSTYELTDLNGVYAGTARFDMTRSSGEQWNLRREINSKGTQEIIAVDMSDKDFRPSESTLIRTDSTGTEMVHAAFDSGQVDMELTTKQNITTNQHESIPSDAREQTTLTMLLRALPLAEGYATRLNVFWPVVGLLDRVTVQVMGDEQVSTAAGDFETWYVQMKTADSETEAWVSKEAPYPVVKMIDSRNRGTFELSEFQPGE